MNKLSIVIPYYKISHFEALLTALASQTHQNFNVYIGDDCSLESPVELIGNYKDKLNIEYKKFEQNMGGMSLTKQWDRCVELIEDEEWVWVLPDDDVPSENCVEEFYKAQAEVKKHDIKVFRFPIKIIDENGELISDTQYDDPIIENNYEFYSRIIRGTASSSLGDNIFNRKSLVQTGGFVSFPKAWGSDHATVLNASVGGTLCCLNKASLSFRMSGENISSDKSDGLIKLQARIQFAQWLKSNEQIFPQKPDNDFYRYFYWKGEYYVLHEWDFSIPLLKALYELRKICFDSSNVLPLMKVVLQKMGLLKT